MKGNLSRRLAMYTAGLFVMTVGIALSVKSRLGVSPISSIPPYTMTCIWGIEMGKATILLHCSLVLLQIILLRRNFKPVNLLQVAVGIVFGYFTTFCNWCVSFLTEPDGIVLRVILLLLSVLCIGSFGSVGVGTVIAAVLVGMVLEFFTKWLGARRDCWLFGKETVRE